MSYLSQLDLYDDCDDGAMVGIMYMYDGGGCLELKGKLWCVPGTWYYKCFTEAAWRGQPQGRQEESCGTCFHPLSLFIFFHSKTASLIR